MPAAAAAKRGLVTSVAVIGGFDREDDRAGCDFEE